MLLNAASRGLTEAAEATVEQMRQAGLAPGPRAYHALVFSYVRAQQPYEALDVAARAADEGGRARARARVFCAALSAPPTTPSPADNPNPTPPPPPPPPPLSPTPPDLRLLPETFVVLIYALLNYADPPDVAKAQLVLESLEAQEGVVPEGGGSGQGGAPGWAMLCTWVAWRGGAGRWRGARRARSCVCVWVCARARACVCARMRVLQRAAAAPAPHARLLCAPPRSKLFARAHAHAHPRMQAQRAVLCMPAPTCTRAASCSARA